MDFYEIMLQQKLAGGGGGGSSDFSTAEVTFTNDAPFSIPVCVNYTEQGVIGIMVDYATTGSHTVPLYKGHAYITTNNTSCSVTGSAEVIMNGYLIDVYGNCTITRA